MSTDEKKSKRSSLPFFGRKSKDVHDDEKKIDSDSNSNSSDDRHTAVNMADATMNSKELEDVKKKEKELDPVGFSALFRSEIFPFLSCLEPVLIVPFFFLWVYFE